MYGTRATADVRAEKIQSKGQMCGVRRGDWKRARTCPLAAAGEHNVLNALAAVAVGLERG